MEYLNRAYNTTMVIPNDTLIRPVDLESHIGETLIFHNGCGYVVSGVLTNATYNNDIYSFLNRCIGIDYHTELDMGMCYFPNRIHSICDSVQYGYEIVVNHITRDELMHNIKYITIPTEKEKPAIEHRYKIMEAWRHIEECLTKTQGKERSNAYNTYKAYSLSETGMSTTFHKKLLGEMTEKERSLLIIHK